MNVGRPGRAALRVFVLGSMMTKSMSSPAIASDHARHPGKRYPTPFSGVSGRYRRLMARTWPRRTAYGQRWQVETTNSMIKRNQGSVVRATTYRSQQRELRLAALTHNTAILPFGEGFYRANLSRFPV